MDINEYKLREEVNSFVTSLQKLLPKKKEIISIIEPMMRVKLTRLTDVHVEAKNVFPKCFIGAKLVILREILDRVKLVQQYNYGKSKENHKCFSQLIHKEMAPKTSLSEDGVLIDSAGCATASYTEVLDGGYIMRLTSSIKDLIASESEVVIEKDSANTLSSVSCTVKDVDPNTLRMVTQLMYKLRPDFCVGTEVAFKPLSFPLAPDYSISARFHKPSYSISSTVSRTGYQVCLYKKFAPDLRLATIVHDGNRNGETSVGVALHKSYRNGSELKIFVDSQRTGGFTFQKDFLFLEAQNEVRVLRLIGSTLIDRQRRVRFGLGINLDF